MSSSRYGIFCGLVLAFGAFCLQGAVCAEDPEPSKAKPRVLLEDRVSTAIKWGVMWLAGQQQADGSWGPCRASHVSYDGTAVRDPTCYVTGPTTFALFALARCGVPRDDEVMKRGLAWARKQLRKTPAREKTRSGHTYTSYESASAILMFTAIYHTPRPMVQARSLTSPPRGSPFTTADWRLMHACIKHLVGGNGKRGCQQRDGSWSYQRQRKDGDVSATQFALLALRAAVRAGYPVERAAPTVWAQALKYLHHVQEEDGSFPYKKGEAWSMGMSTAGVASLLIAREQLRLLGTKPPTWVDPAVERGLALVGRHYDPAYNKAGDQRAGLYYQYCYVYAVERVGSLARRTRLGEHDWFAVGAEWLLGEQQKPGHWEDPSGMQPIATMGTCFALLFLKRATLPVVTGAAQPK